MVSRAGSIHRGFERVARVRINYELEVLVIIKSKSPPSVYDSERKALKIADSGRLIVELATWILGVSRDYRLLRHSRQQWRSRCNFSFVRTSACNRASPRSSSRKDMWVFIISKFIGPFNSLIIYLFSFLSFLLLFQVQAAPTRGNPLKLFTL